MTLDSSDFMNKVAIKISLVKYNHACAACKKKKKKQPYCVQDKWLSLTFSNICLYAGIKEKLSHFQYLNIKAIWISPIYKSPMKDFGYDVEDFRDVDPLFGTMADFDDLLSNMHNMGEHKSNRNPLHQ